MSAVGGPVKAMYESELQQKTERLKDLEKKWWEQAMGNPQKSREEEDRNQMLRWFALQGWRGEEEDAITDDRLGSLIARARAYKQLYDKWRESVRDRPAREQGEPVVEVDWNSSPFSSDGGAAAGNVGEATGTTGQVPEGTTIKVTPGGQGGGADYLIYTVKLLALCREDDLDMLDRFSGERKRLAVYRIIRRQKFLEFTEAKIRRRRFCLSSLILSAYSRLGSVGKRKRLECVSNQSGGQKFLPSFLEFPVAKIKEKKG
eukprot:gene25346-11005_t